MLTFEKVLAVFESYLNDDPNCEVVMTSRGYTVMVWDRAQMNWYSSEFCPTPERLMEELLDWHENYHQYLLTDGKRDLTEQEEEWLQTQRNALRDKCIL